MTMLRPDGALVVKEFGLDPDSRMVRRRKAMRPHEQWLAAGWIAAGHYEAARRYLRAYEIGLLGARGADEPMPARDPVERFHEAQSHHLHTLMKAQAYLRAHERTVLDCTLIYGMSLDAYGAEVLLLATSKPYRIGTVQGLVLGALDALCAHWQIAVDLRKTITA
jgi:hypothetical protein